MVMCPETNAIGCISNTQYYNQLNKFTNNQLRAKKVNKFMIDFKLLDKSLIQITRPLIPQRHNPDLFVFVLETTLTEFADYISIPDIQTFYKDIPGGSCEYDNHTKTLIKYRPRQRFKFYNEGKLIYCTVNNDYENNPTYGSHASLISNPAFINIAKMSNAIKKEVYKTDNGILQQILDNIITLFDIKGTNKNKVAKLLILCMSQESLGILIYFVGKLFEWKYSLFNQLSDTIYKSGTKYIIKQSNLIRGSEIINDAVATYNDKFKLTYVIDESDPRLIIKIEITDIDGLIKSYDPNPKKIKFINY